MPFGVGFKRDHAPNLWRELIFVYVSMRLSVAAAHLCEERTVTGHGQALQADGLQA